MLCKDFIEVIEDTYPKSAAEDWDNVGLLVGRMYKEIRKIYVALDATDEVIDEAIRLKADLLITHHPLIFSPLKQVATEDMIGGRIFRLVQSDICYYAMHTNYDVLRMAELASKGLGLKDTEVMNVTNEMTGDGIGRVGTLFPPLSVRALAELLKKKFELESVKIYGDLDAMIERVAISPGSGKHMCEDALSRGAQAFVTAEIDHHEALDANAMGMAILDAGHYGLEHIFIEDMVNFLNANTQGVEIVGDPLKHPFCVI